MAVDENYILAEFKGIYRAPHPEGVKDAAVTKPFHVKVKMKRECLEAPGLNGLFATYYKEHLRKLHPDMIDTYQYDLVCATELDGSVINDPKALDYEGLLNYVSKKKYTINTSLYSPSELRNEVVLYEVDKEGQQSLEKQLEKRKGSMIAITNELMALDDLMVPVTEDKPAQSVESLLAGKRAK